jgi:hypothetical protein
MALQKSAMLNTMSVSHWRFEKSLIDIVTVLLVQQPPSWRCLYLPAVCCGTRLSSSVLYVWRLLVVDDVTISGFCQTVKFYRWLFVAKLTDVLKRVMRNFKKFSVTLKDYITWRLWEPMNTTKERRCCVFCKHAILIFAIEDTNHSPVIHSGSYIFLS